MSYSVKIWWGSLAGDPDHHRGILPAADAFQHPHGRLGPEHPLGVAGEALTEEPLGDVSDCELLHWIFLLALDVFIIASFFYLSRVFAR